MGTYKFKPTVLFVRSNGAMNFGVAFGAYPATDAALVNAIAQDNAGGGIYWSNDAGTLGTGVLVFTGAFFLDGSATPLTINQLPPGFKITSCDLNFKSGTFWSTRSLTYQFFVQIAAELEQQLPFVASNTNTVSITPAPSALAVNGFLIFRIVKIAADGNPTFAHFYLEGNYIIESFSWAVSSNTTSITITSDGVNPNLTQIDSVTLAFGNSSVESTVVVVVDKSKFTTQTATSIVLPLPEVCTFTGDILVMASSISLNINDVLAGTVTI